VTGPELNQVGNDLRVVLGRIVRRLRQGHQSGELTLSELSVLSRLDRGGTLPAGDVAEAEGISPQATSTILATLERQGLVSRDADADDGRRARMSATPAGRTLLAGRRSLNARRMTDALHEALTQDELRQLAEVIPLLERLVNRL
jgi:DNA-binding MarR family transcriptional regulator